MGMPQCGQAAAEEGTNFSHFGQYIMDLAFVGRFPSTGYIVICEQSDNTDEREDAAECPEEDARHADHAVHGRLERAGRDSAALHQDKTGKRQRCDEEREESGKGEECLIGGMSQCAQALPYERQEGKRKEHEGEDGEEDDDVWKDLHRLRYS